MSLQQRGMLSKREEEEYVHFLYAEQDSNYLFSSLYFQEWDHFSPSRFSKKLSSKAQGKGKSKRAFSGISFKIVLLVLLLPVNNITYQFIKTLQPAISKFWLLQPFGCNLNAILGDNKLQDGTRTLPQGWAKLLCVFSSRKKSIALAIRPLVLLPISEYFHWPTGAQVFRGHPSPRRYPDLKTMQASAR